MPFLWPSRSSQLREAHQLLRPFRYFVDDYAQQRQRSVNPGWAVAEQCRWPLNVLFLVHSGIGRRRERRVLLRNTMFEPRIVKYFNWTAVFFKHDREKWPLENARVNLEVEEQGDLVDFSLSTPSIQANASRRQRDIRRTQATLDVLRWAYRHCPRAWHVVEMRDNVLPKDPFMLMRYLRDYVDPTRPLIACRLAKARRRGVGSGQDRRRGRKSWNTEASSAKVVRYCAGSPRDYKRAAATTRVLTKPALRGLYLESLAKAPRFVGDAYVTGDLALAASVGHVDFAEASERYILRKGVAPTFVTVPYTSTFVRMPSNLTLFRKEWWQTLRRGHRYYERAFNMALSVTDSCVK
ncbi:hypothetical protein V5799_022929 [Amblyomma americanum]|uniref:Uncharacterized protein n=1 Tax=Amblyomma americanum TaxID=6943 RepID=A0AAQ4FKM2_AMBAM